MIEGGMVIKKPYFDYLLNGIPFPAAQTIIIGDLNTGLHQVDEAVSTFHCAGEFKALCKRCHDRSLTVAEK